MKQLNRFFRFFTDTYSTILSGGIFSIGLGTLVLFGWVFDISSLTSFGNQFIPMAPSTAVFFIVFGIILLRYTQLPTRERSPGLMILIGIFTGAALVLLVLSLWGLLPDAEHLGMAIQGMVSGVPIGHMSPLTAFCFLLAGVSLIILFWAVKDEQLLKAAFALSIVLVLISVTLILAYLFGGPFLYGNRTIPPALPTALGFLGLGIPLVVESGRRGWPESFRSLLNQPSPHLWNIGLSMVATLALISLGNLYFQNYKEYVRQEAGSNLAAIADLKVSQLTQWRNERMGDAEILYQNPVFSDLLQSYLQQHDTEKMAQLRSWLQNVKKAYSYERIVLLDTSGSQQIMAIPPDSFVDFHLYDVRETLTKREITMLDFHLDSRKRVHLLTLVPIFTKPPLQQTLGILALRIAPEQTLYPMIQEWPTPLRTFETLLLRQEGDSVLFLNDLRFRENAALHFRIPMTREDLSAVMAIQKPGNTVQGVDYRGKQVLAALRAVPNSPWYLVVNVD